jgi:MFS family permease
MTDGHTTLYEDPAIHARRWWILAVLCLGVMVVFMNNSALNIAIPTLERDLQATSSELQWTIAIYSLVFAGLLFTTGALGDRYGRKGILQIGLGTFLVATLLTSQADEMGQIITGRAVMGVAAACVLPATLSIVVNVFPPGERVVSSAKHAFVDGIHLAGTIGAAFAVVSIGIVLRYLPRNTIQQGARTGPTEVPQEVGALDLAGAPPAFADD